MEMAADSTSQGTTGPQTTGSELRTRKGADKQSIDMYGFVGDTEEVQASYERLVIV